MMKRDRKELALIALLIVVTAAQAALVIWDWSRS